MIGVGVGLGPILSGTRWLRLKRSFIGACCKLLKEEIALSKCKSLVAAVFLGLAFYKDHGP